MAMHVILEEARKAAGISGMKGNYPEDPKQRGAGYWGAYNGSLNTILARKDQDYIDTIAKHSKEVRAAHVRVEDLEAELRRVKDHSIATGIEVVRQQEGWSIERGREALKTIAG
jgi:hypothetical protein